MDESEVERKQYSDSEGSDGLKRTLRNQHSFASSERPSTKDRRLPRQDSHTQRKVQQLSEQQKRLPLRGTGSGLLSKAAGQSVFRSHKSGVHVSVEAMHVPSQAVMRRGSSLEKRESFGVSNDVQVSLKIPYMKKLYWVCEQMGYPHEYADLVGSQFLGLDSAVPITHIDGHVPPVSELVEFMAQAFMRITDFADLILVFVDDFQWVDSFTWKVIRALGQSGRRMILICATRSHDKQALRRMSTAVNFRLEITIGPLDLPEIRQLIASTVGCSEDAVDEQLCTQIYSRTGGLPVFVVELLETLKRRKSLKKNDEGTLFLEEDGEAEDVSA